MAERGGRSWTARGWLLLGLVGLGGFALSGLIFWPRDDWTLFGVLPVAFFIPYVASVVVRALVAIRQGRKRPGPPVPEAAPQPILDHVVDATQLAWTAAVFVQLGLHADALHDWPRLAASVACVVLACTGYIVHRRAHAEGA
jgi:hypothetical protein